MDSTTAQQWQIPEGTDVVGADGEKVGKVVAAESSYIVVEKGFFFPTDYYIPTNAINNYDGDKVYLTVTKDEALNQGWDQEITDTGYSADATYTTPLEGDRLAGVSTTGLASSVDMAATDTTIRDAGVYDETIDVGTERAYATSTELTDTDTMRIPVHEEELTATKRDVERGQVRIDKDIVSEERTLEVPITEERVTITRRAVDREGSADDFSFQEDTIEIPLHSEEVDLQKRVRVAEEIDIAKDAVQRTEQVSGTVRREVVNVDEVTSDVTTRDRVSLEDVTVDRDDVR